jgi:hypothetical protein
MLSVDRFWAFTSSGTVYEATCLLGTYNSGNSVGPFVTKIVARQSCAMAHLKVVCLPWSSTLS